MSDDKKHWLKKHNRSSSTEKSEDEDYSEIPKVFEDPDWRKYI